MGKLIINHGERVTEHPLGIDPLVIGRDPQCDLFFADKKLSRRHARVEPDGPGFRIVDLDSRNGSWVNEERVHERRLEDGDELRLGGLRITIECDAPILEEEEEADDATIYLRPGADVTGTVAFDASAAPPTSPTAPREQETLALGRPSPEPDVGATRALSADEVVAAYQAEVDDEGDETLRRGDPEAGPAQTVVFPGESQRRAYDTGTVMFRSTVDPRIQAMSDAAAAVPADAHPGAGASAAETASESTFTTLDGGAAGRDLAPGERASERETPHASGPGAYVLRLAALVATAALFAIAVLAVPLMGTLGAAVAEESELRGRALVGLLAAANETALGQARLAEVTVRRVAEEPGVTEAFVLDTAGRIVAPAARAGEPLELAALDAPLMDVRHLQSARTETGELLLAEPVSYRGRRVGVAVVALRTASAGWPALVLILSSALLLMGLATAVFLTKRLTLAPVRELQRDVESLPETPSRVVSTERPFIELSELARSVNRVLVLGRSKPESEAGSTPGASRFD